MDCSQGSIRIPIETDSEFQRAFSASFGTLPIERTGVERGTLWNNGICKGFAM